MGWKKLVLVWSLLYSTTVQLKAQTGQFTVIQFTLANKQAAENANILLSSLDKKESHKVIVADRSGIIRIPADGLQYRLYATFIGMDPIIDSIIAITRKDTLRYTFQQSVTELAEVRVSSSKKLLEVKEDRFIYNVSADSMARSKSLSQVLTNLPFVTVDGAGEVQVAGQTSYRVLMNGKETALFVSSIAQALRSFPAEIVSRIELITSPAARYDAEGITAIINIITKKFGGYKGFQTLYSSNLTHFSTGLTLTGRSGKLGITVNATSDGTWKPLTEYRSIVTTPLSASVYKERTLNIIDAGKRLTNAATMELNFEMDSLHSVIGYISTDRTSTDNGLEQDVITQLPGGIYDKGYITANGTDRSPGLTAGLDYKQIAKKNPKKELLFRFNWRGNSNQINHITAQKYTVFNKWMINQSAARNDEYTFQLDAIPVASDRYTVEAGTKIILRQASADYTSRFTFDKDSNYIKDSANSNRFNYEQQVYAAYGTVTAKIGKNSFRVGLRLERTNIKGIFSNLSNAVQEDYLSLVPNFYWSRKTGQHSSVSLAYNLQLLRPYITSLNPFVNNIDSFNISYGNPGLGPQQIHKLVAQLRYNKGRLFFTTTLMGSYSNNQILSYRLFNAATGITAVTFGNVGKEALISVGGSINYQFSKKFKAGLWGDIRYVDIQNRLQKEQHNSGYSGIVGHFFTWDAGNRFSLSGSGGVDVRNVSLLGRRSPYIFYQINSGYHIIKNKLFATINWNNVHSSYFTLRTHFQDNAVKSETTAKRLYRVIFVGFQYTFGKLREEVGRKKGVVNDDIL